MEKKKIPWDDLKNEYVTTNASYRNLSKKYGVNVKRICERGKADGWVEARKQHRAKLGAAVQEAAIQEAVKEGLKHIREIGDVACESIPIIKNQIKAAPNGTQAEASVSALRALLLIIRDCYGILTTQEQTKVDMDRARLELEQKKADRFADQDGSADKIVIGSEVYGV